MSKFNQTNTMKTTNQSGYTAYKMFDKDKLVTQVLTSFWQESKYYGDNTNDLVETAKKVLDKDAKFVANLARYARKELHLRSVSHALTAIIANHLNGKPYIKAVVNDVVERADDITEILACYLSMYGKPIPNGLKKALAHSFNKFNEYQIAKYNGGNKAVKFKDVLKLTHARPTSEEQEKLFKDIMNDTLPIAERWETELSAKGNNKETWEYLIAENKLGYMAMLRNLRNILNAKPNNISKVYEKLENKEEVLKSKQLPFRFFSAYREIQTISTSKTLDVLENAIEYSVENLPKLKGKTVIAIDVSGSMRNSISNKSTVKCSDIARLLAVLASKICEEYIVYTFDTSLNQVTFSKRGGIIETAMSLPFDGGGTNITLPLQEMINNNIQADRLLIFSDNEINQSWRTASHNWWTNVIISKPCQHYADEYRKKVNPNLWVHAIDLQGYGTQQFIGAKTNIIAGWGEKILEFITIAEKGIGNQVKIIENYE